MNVPHDTALVVLSGGQDSTTCLYQAIQSHTHVHAITFDYGQRHRIEIQAARRIAHFANVDSHEVLKLPHDMLKSTSPLVSDAPLEQYKDADSLPGGIEKTFVPMRNQLFLTLAYNRAIALGAKYIYTGVCEADYGGYPDCRAVFVKNMECTSNLGTSGDPARPCRIITPLMNLDKAATVKLALHIKDCWEALGLSHTAYDGRETPDGHDHASLLRARGFEQAGVPDPLVLRAVWEARMEMPKTANYRDDKVAPYIPRLQYINSWLDAYEAWQEGHYAHS